MRLGVSGDAEAASPLHGSIIVSGDGGAVLLAQRSHARRGAPSHSIVTTNGRLYLRIASV